MSTDEKCPDAAEELPEAAAAAGANVCADSDDDGMPRADARATLVSPLSAKAKCTADNLSI